MSYPENDLQFEDHAIKQIKSLPEYWEVVREDGWSFDVPKKEGISEPKPGDYIRFYGAGIGYGVRGIFINGQEIYYKTVSQADAEHQKWCAEQKKSGEEAYQKEKGDRNRRISELPEVLQKRLQGFFARNKDFRTEYESYELFACEQAALFARELKTEDAIIGFSKLPYEKQKELVPGLSDNHSGNTFGFACVIAKILVSDNPDLAIIYHGAMCPLLGCKEYGCIQATQGEKNEKD